MSKARLAIALVTLSVATVAWAVPDSGAAHQRVQSSVRSVFPVRLHDGRDGLVADVWINGSGPFVFAIDTGAGVSLIRRSVVERARLQVTRSSRPLVGGLSTAPIASNEETRFGSLALGQPNNRIATSAVAAVVANLPGAIDGILDPTDVFRPLGYSVDLPNHELRVFDGRLRANENPPGGAVVRWVGNDRPLVRLSDGRLALIDTGSGFGLGLTDGRVIGGRNHGQVDNRTDLGGGSVQSHPVAPQRVSIGVMVLNGVPSDVLTGVAPGTPLILGRRALFPFRITFDPVSRLISFEPGER